jgi:hypothetical protein
MAHFLEKRSLTTSQDDNSPQLAADKRQAAADTQFILVELDPTLVLAAAPERDDSADLRLFGQMRETCPECRTTHLQLVLRQKHVKLAHLFCLQCKKCFDACYPNGSSALAIH